MAVLWISLGVLYFMVGGAVVDWRNEKSTIYNSEDILIMVFWLPLLLVIAPGILGVVLYRRVDAWLETRAEEVPLSSGQKVALENRFKESHD